MEKKYLIRLDDACPTMNRDKWGQIEVILDRYHVKPMVGVIPHVEDPQQTIDPVDMKFWEKVQGWVDKSWSIALHGYNHCYNSNCGLQGLNPMWMRSEFAGLPLEEQRQKIRLGVSIMREHGINPHCFFAPSHTFDENTLAALFEESDIRVISDTIALRPYRYEGFVFIPQIVGSVRNIHLPGVFTFCYHPNTMRDSDFIRLDNFISKNKSSFLTIGEIPINNLRNKGWVDKMLTEVYFFYRKLRKLR